MRARSHKAYTRTSSLTVTDQRTPAEVAEEIRRLGYEAVWKDWDKVFD